MELDRRSIPFSRFQTSNVAGALVVSDLKKNAPEVGFEPTTNRLIPTASGLYHLASDLTDVRELIAQISKI